MADQGATFSIDLQGNVGATSRADAAELENLRAKVQASQDAVKAYSATLRTLTGTGKEVTDAKAKLKAAIDREKTASSEASVKIVALGKSYGQLAAEAKKAAAAQTGTSAAISAVGGPVSGLVERFESLKDVLGKGSASSLVLGGALALLAVAVVAITAAVVSSAVAFAHWIVSAADAARAMNLVRLAATGSEENARNLGTQIDQLAKKLPIAKEELNSMASDMYRRFNNTAATGKTIVDTFNLVAQASASMGATVGKQLGDIVERGKRIGRLQINPLELQGTGIKFKDVAGELAKSMRISVEQAQKALFEGRVKLEDGADALRKAVDARFGKINAEKVLSLDVQFQKFKENLQNLATGVNLRPLLVALADFFRLFDSSTVTGATLKQLITLIGDGLVKAFVFLEPYAKQFFKGLIIGALDVGIAFLKVKNWIGDAFGTSTLSAANVMKGVLLAAKGAVYGLAAGLAIAAAMAYVAAAPFLMIAKGVDKLVQFKNSFNVGQADVTSGKNLNTPGATALVAPAHAEGGMVMRPAPGELFASVAPGEQIVPAGAAGRSGAGGGGLTVNVTLNVGGGANGKAVAKELSSPSFLEQLVKVLEEACRTAGIPVQTGALP